MRTILFILQKEFTQVFRNKIMIPIIFVVPLVQLIILVNAATLEMKNIDILFVDMDHSQTSRGLAEHFYHSPFFNSRNSANSVQDALDAIAADHADIAIVLPAGMEKSLVRNEQVKIQLLVNAINGTVAGIGNTYATRIIREYNSRLVTEWYPARQAMPGPKRINPIVSFWYNPELNYKVFMVPAVLVILVTVTGALLAGLNLVREKEMGTIEQINVTPIKKYEFIIGKLVPFWMIAMVELAFGLLLGKLLFNIPILGNLLLLFGVATIFLIVVQSFSLLISTVSNTQQQAMFLIFFFMLIFILMSGVFTPVDSIPVLARKLDLFNPMYYFMKIIRMILLKGSGLRDILPDLGAMSVLAVAMMSLAIWRYRKIA
ncbi:MAG: ABC transporter permease [Bacteroidales bacterium]